jgi:hypothetical protein
MLLVHLREPILRESLRHADKRGPKTAMNQSYLPFDQPAYEDLA